MTSVGVSNFSGLAVSIYVPDIDTDTLIPIDYCINRDRPNFDVGLFRSWRFNDDGTAKKDFILNCEPYLHSQILIAGANFGCGSSREMAVWALRDFGIHCVIAPSFGEIFYNNCFQNNLLAAQVSQASADRINQAAVNSDGLHLTVDIGNNTIRSSESPTLACEFELDSLRCEMLKKGIDPTTATLTRDSEIANFERNDRELRPWAYRM